MRERLEGLLGAAARGHLDPHLPRRVRPHPPPRGARGSATARTSRSTTRPTRCASSSSCLEELERDPKRFAPRGIHAQISTREEPADRPGRVPRRASPRFYDQTVADVYELYQRRLFGVERGRLRRPADADRRRARSASPRRSSAGRTRSATSSSTSTRTRTTRSTGLLQLLAGEHRNVFAVGDPDQSIYAFRGADIRNILDFERDFPEAQTIALEQNYRSTNSILDAANRGHRAQPRAQAEEPLVRARRGRAGARDRGRGRARRGAVRRRARSRSSSRRGSPASEIAVFYRTNAQSRVLEDVLVRQQVPYQVIGGPRFYERAEIKDRDRVPPGDRQPGRRRLARPDREPAAPRHRRRLARPAAELRRRFTGSPCWEALARADEAGVGRRAAPRGAVVRAR